MAWPHGNQPSQRRYGGDLGCHWCCYAAMGWEWELSALFGALVVVTGPTVIQPMIRSIRPINKLANILRWEGIIIDPVGALLAVWL